MNYLYSLLTNIFVSYVTKRSNVTIFLKVVYSNPPEKNNIAKKTDVHHIDDTWSLDAWDFNDPKSAHKIWGFGIILVAIDKFSNFGWKSPLKIINRQTITNSSECILNSFEK